MQHMVSLSKYLLFNIPKQQQEEDLLRKQVWPGFSEEDKVAYIHPSYKPWNQGTACNQHEELQLQLNPCQHISCCSENITLCFNR